MINKIKSFIWRTDGMEFNNPRVITEAVFHLFYGKLKIGTLTYKSNLWKFEYSEEFKQSTLNTIIDFPDKNRVYENEELWPFFATRIPTINQPYQIKKIRKANIDENDSVGLLRLFGNETITNPFQLQSV